jgi:hypothetical protein
LADWSRLPTFSIAHAVHPPYLTTPESSDLSWLVVPLCFATASTVQPPCLIIIHKDHMVWVDTILIVPPQDLLLLLS